MPTATEVVYDELFKQSRLGDTGIFVAAKDDICALFAEVLREHPQTQRPLLVNTRRGDRLFYSLDELADTDNKKIAHTGHFLFDLHEQIVGTDMDLVLANLLVFDYHAQLKEHVPSSKYVQSVGGPDKDYKRLIGLCAELARLRPDLQNVISNMTEQFARAAGYEMMDWNAPCYTIHPDAKTAQATERLFRPDNTTRPAPRQALPRYRATSGPQPEISVGEIRSLRLVLLGEYVDVGFDAVLEAHQGAKYSLTQAAQILGLDSPLELQHVLPRHVGGQKEMTRERLILAAVYLITPPAEQNRYLPRTG